MSRDSDQLDLWPDWVERIRRSPWEGRQPRGLTKVALGLYLRREPQKSVRDLLWPAQLELFPEAIRTEPPLYEGAPPLEPLPWEA